MKHDAEAGGRSHLIAVIENDPSLGRALARLLRALGYRAELFVSAADFMNAAPSTDAMCIIVDIDLGSSTSGLELARRLAAAGFEFPTIFMTGLQGDHVQAQCVNAGCVAFLRKPFPEDRLIDAVTKAIASNRHVEKSIPLPLEPSSPPS